MKSSYLIMGICLTSKRTYDRLNENYGKEIFIMQIVRAKRYWHMVNAWLVNFFNLLLVYPYKIMLS